jgi:hypothetical protein
VWEPPRRFGGAGIASAVTFDEENELRPTEKGTPLTQTIMARPRGPFRLIEPVLRRQLHRLISDDLERLRTLIEAETAPANQ